MSRLYIPNVVVTGSRHFRDGDRIESDLRALVPLGLRRVAQGGNGVRCRRCSGIGSDKCFCCKGTGLPSGHCEVCSPLRIASADALAWRATHRLGFAAAMYRVDEKLDGRWPACGPNRNRRMLRKERPALVPAYPTPTSKGTWSCIAEAWKLRIPALVWIHWETGNAATRIVTQALQQRGVKPNAITECGHRVFVGSPDFAAALPEELLG